MNCNVCNSKLNASRWSTDGDWKACPNCSNIEGKRHVYYPFPDRFGETPARASASNPNGPQSYCVECRADHPPAFAGAKYCDELDSVSKQPL